MNGKFKVRLTQPLNVNEGKILPLERAVKKWAPFAQSNVLPYLPKAEGSFQPVDGAPLKLDHASEKAGCKLLLSGAAINDIEF